MPSTAALALVVVVAAVVATPATQNPDVERVVLKKRLGLVDVRSHFGAFSVHFPSLFSARNTLGSHALLCFSVHACELHSLALWLAGSGRR